MIMHQGLGKVAESLAKRLLISEGFEVRYFSFHVGSYIAGIHYARGLSDVERQKLWDELLEEQGAPFGHEKVRKFVDELIDFKKSRGKGQSLGGAIDLIALRGNELLLVEVKSARSRLTPRQMKASEIARRHENKTCIMRVNFEVKFEDAELFEVKSYHDTRIVNNIPYDTLN